ncbi:MAG: thiolase family protein [Chloroflexi bacterium]|nr:thiolase family protein [Chloroflexota bacterium]
MKLNLGDEKNACIVGVGRSMISRDSGKTATTLATDACVAAIRDAGLTSVDIDGLATNEMGLLNGYQLRESLGLSNVSWYGQMGLPQVTATFSMIEAAMAVEYGASSYAVVVMGAMKPRGNGSRRDPFAGMPRPPRIGGEGQWSAPFGGNGFSFVHWMSRYIWQYGAPRETFGHIALTARKHAQDNERAIARSPLTMDDYLNARWISKPFCLYDCDYPVDGYAAVVITTPDRARHLPHRPVSIIAGSQKTGPRTETMLWDDMSNMGATYCSREMWELAEGTGIRPEDVQVACLYDGFTILTVNWLEALGFINVGEAKDVLVGDALQLGSSGPGPVLNPHGGMLSEGRVHGMGFVAEAADQLMGRSGVRQVPDARIAVVSNGAGVQNCSMLLKALD